MAAIDSLSDPRWEAVVRRREAGTSRFVYGVVTTGVYCRPSCPSRRPLRRNVRFFTSAEEARVAGFRACRRCEPDAEHPAYRRLAQAAARRIEATLGDAPGLAELAADLEVSSRHLHRCFKRAFGVTPRSYARALRDARFREELRAGETIAAATYGAGFGSSHAAYRSAERGLGMTPGRFRAGGAGERLRYAVFESAIGWLAIAASERGVALLAHGPSAAALETRLRDEFPRADLRADPAGLAGWTDALRAYLGGRGPWPELPTDVEATVFQARVLRALRELPPGSRVSYAELARAIGAPRAVRAVASACARNPAPLVIPCHRIVRSDGAPGGYALGAETKRTLLEIEARYGDAAPESGTSPCSARRSSRTR